MDHMALIGVHGLQQVTLRRYLTTLPVTFWARRTRTPPCLARQPLGVHMNTDPLDWPWLI